MKRAANFVSRWCRANAAWKKGSVLVRENRGADLRVAGRTEGRREDGGEESDKDERRGWTRVCTRGSLGVKKTAGHSKLRLSLS